MSPFEFDGQLSMRVIFMMEKVGEVPLLLELADKNQAFQKQIQVRQPDIPSAMIRWLSSSGDAHKMKPTWRNLSQVLQEIGLGELAIQMEDFLLEQTIGEQNRVQHI